MNTNSVTLQASSSQFLSITNANQTGLNFNSNFTFEAWIKLAQLPSTANVNMTILGRDGYSTSASRSYIMQFNRTTDRLTVFYFSNNTTFTYFQTDSACVVSGDVGNWVHLAAAVNISDKTAVIYKNGSSIDSTRMSSNSSSIQAGTEPFRIGGQRESGNVINFFDGQMDDVRIWTTIRTASEISNNMNKELAGNEANLVGYWKLNNSLLDETSNNNDLTNNNSATFSTDVPFTGAVANTTNFFFMFN
jgi:hypothetical protein